MCLTLTVFAAAPSSTISLAWRAGWEVQAVIAFGWCNKAGAKTTFLGWMRFTVPIVACLLLTSWKLLVWRYPCSLPEVFRSIRRERA